MVFGAENRSNAVTMESGFIAKRKFKRFSFQQNKEGGEGATYSLNSNRCMKA